jgi:DNA invertase Pin-like site-specific DNA recombinase
MIDTMKKQCVIYTRKSTDKQESEEAQIFQCRMYAKVKGFEVVASYSEGGCSSRSQPSDRSVWASMVASLKPGMVILVYKRDRIARGADIQRPVIDYWASKGVEIHSTAEPNGYSAADTLIIDILGTVSRFALDTIRENTSKGLQQRKGNMQKYCRRIYGFRPAAKGEELKQCPKEQAVIERIQSEYEKGKSLNQISIDLNLAKIPAPTGKRWYHTSVASVIRTAESLTQSQN